MADIQDLAIKVQAIDEVGVWANGRKGLRNDDGTYRVKFDGYDDNYALMCRGRVHSGPSTILARKVCR